MIIYKSVKAYKRWAREWESGEREASKVVELVRRETWWLLYCVPLYTHIEILKRQR